MYEYETFEEALEAVEAMASSVAEDLGIDVDTDVACDLAESVAFDSSPSVRKEIARYYGIEYRVAEIKKLRAGLRAPAVRPKPSEKAIERAKRIRSRIVDVRKTVAPEIRR